MAFVIGKKLVTDTADFNDYAYGLKLPVILGSTGYFEQAFTSFDQSRANLLNLLLTNKGERIMQPEFGSGLRALLFEQMTDTLVDDLQTTITETVGFWLPYINIDDIEVFMTDEMRDENTAEMSIKFTVGSDITSQEITFTIQG